MACGSRFASGFSCGLAWTIIGVFAVTLWPATATAQTNDSTPLFERDVEPILTAHCVKCHGNEHSEAGLDLSHTSSLMKGGDEGPVVVEGSAAMSLLFQRIAAGEMPPPREKNPLSAEQVATIQRWIDGGALNSSGNVAPAAAADQQVTADDRRFWAFLPPVAAPVPRPKAMHRVCTPIDAFLLDRQEASGLTFSPDADRPTLLRRAYLDLLGLPPSPEDLQAFLADPSKDAYERVIDRLLASPHYGERWGRHWLDTAGYTDSPHCDIKGEFLSVDDWRFRDYVVSSFNEDKPYDRFLTEQLAGDELVDWSTATKYTPQLVEALVATGYLRTTPDWTHGDQMQAAQNRYDTIARVVDNVSTGVLGLTMGCGRCHAHKFDPIPQQDYYRLLAVFATAYNLDDWRRPADRYLPDVSRADQAEIDIHNAKLDALEADHQVRKRELQRPIRQRLFAEKLTTVPELLREDVQTAFDTSADKRDLVQRYLFKKFEASLHVPPEDVRKYLSVEDQGACSVHEQEIARLRSSRRSFRRIQALFDLGPPPIVRQLKRGDAGTQGPIVEAGWISVLCQPGQSAVVRPPETKGASSGRRLALANWLTNRAHPLTARVMVNRIWQHHFGKGIVATPENFGHSGTPPTHPELLDWLAVDFMEHGWRIKRLHALIMTSTAYCQSAHRPSAGSATAADPENALLWRMNLRRLEAEAIRDSVLAVSARLDPTM